LHAGRVVYGNIGGQERLDFTAVGPTVNIASRLERIAKERGRAVLLTEAVARHLDEPLEDLGRHAIDGVAEPLRLYAAKPGQD
jgi:adenylate cyclase